MTFEATHKIKGSGYELQRKSRIESYGYVDKHGNELTLPDGAVEKVTLPEPADGTLWKDDYTGNYYHYCKQERKFLSLIDTMRSDEIPVEVYESKDRGMTRVHPYEHSYPAGQMLQDVLDNFGASNKPQVEIYWDYGRVKVVLSTWFPDRSWSGTGETVEKAVENLNWNMIE